MASVEIPIFPLGNVVLFPGCAVPLHIFEPRYRQMTADAIESGRVIGMVTVRPEDSPEMAGNPDVYPIGCAGFIERHRQLADGRYQIVLRATERFRILEELPASETRLYRVARVEALVERDGDPSASEASREQVIEQLGAIARGADADAMQGFDGARLRELELAAFANGVAQAIDLPVQEKQGLLEADSIEERLTRLEGALGFHLAARAQAAPRGSETVH